MATPASPPSQPSRPRRVLFAEDDEWVREDSVASLVDMGFEVVAVNDGEEAEAAFRQARACGAPFDVAILDVRMPRRHGTELLPELLAEDHEILVLLSSGYERAHLDPVLFDSGRVGFVPKPAEPEQILAELRELEVAARGGAR